MPFIVSDPARKKVPGSDGVRRRRASDRPQRAPRADAGADALSLYRADVGEEALLSAEEESNIGRAIAAAERGVIEALVQSSAGRVSLAELGRELESGEADVRTVILNPDEQGLDLRALRAHLTDTLLSAGTSTDAERAGIADALTEIRLSQSALERVIADVRGSRVATDAAAFDAVEASRAELQRAKSRLVLGNLRLVLHFARRYRNQGIALLDLVQEGNVGLMRAADKFDFRRGFRFNTYASYWIKQALQRALVHRTFRIPVHVASDRHRIARMRARFVALNEREPTVPEIAKLTGLSHDRVQSILDFPKQPGSLDAPIGEDGESRLGDFIPSDAASAEDEVAASALGDQLHDLLSELSERERRVVRMRFGIGPEREHSLEEVGRELSLTRERIRQIERRALEKLRVRSKDRDLQSYLRD